MTLPVHELILVVLVILALELATLIPAAWRTSALLDACAEALPR